MMAENPYVIYGPTVPTPTGIIYYVTLLSGQIVTNPDGFGVQTPPAVLPQIPFTNEPSSGTEPRKLEDYKPGATRKEVFEALRRAAQPIKNPAPKPKKHGGSPAQASS